MVGKCLLVILYEAAPRTCIVFANGYPISVRTTNEKRGRLPSPLVLRCINVL